MLVIVRIIMEKMMKIAGGILNRRKGSHIFPTRDGRALNF